MLHTRRIGCQLTGSHMKSRLQMYGDYRLIAFAPLIYFFHLFILNLFNYRINFSYTQIQLSSCKNMKDFFFTFVITSSTSNDTKLNGLRNIISRVFNLEWKLSWNKIICNFSMRKYYVCVYTQCKFHYQIKCGTKSRGMKKGREQLFLECKSRVEM